MPIRSTGCITCRKRKIRCDETRPGCQRCTTHGVQCPGYRTDPGALEFKDQTIVTEKRAKEQYRTKAANSTSTWKRSNGSASPTPLTTDSSPTSSSNVSFLLPVDEGFTKNESLVLANGDDIQFNLPPIPFLSPGLERTRLYNEFITTYLPKTQTGAQNGHFSFFQALAVKCSNQPALQDSLDALSLVQVGSIYKDQALLKQAVKQYGNALSSLARSIAKGKFVHDDDVLAAVSVMATCELYQEIQGMGQGWAKHVQGSEQLMALRGPKSLKSNLALLLYSNMRHGSLCHAFIARKAPFMATQEWREVAFRFPAGIMDASTMFYDIALQIPGLLQRHDELDLGLPAVLDDIDKLLSESAELESELRNWFISYQARALLRDQVVCELRSIDDFATFTSLCSDRTFNQAYTFPDFLIAYLHSLYWMSMFYLRTNTQSLQKHRHKILENWYPEQDSVVPENELLGYILNMCQCIPFFVEPISSSAGSIGIFLPMRCAALYFTAHGHWTWLKWVGNLRNSVFVKGLAPPSARTDVGKVLPGP